MKDMALLDQMYEKNLEYYKELTMYILAGRQTPCARSTNDDACSPLRGQGAAVRPGRRTPSAANDFANLVRAL